MSDLRPNPAAEPVTPGWRYDVRVSMAFLTRFPFEAPALAPGGLADAVRGFPIVGAVLGFGGGLVYALAEGIGLPPAIGAMLAVFTLIVATGALHEDGLADTADGLGGRDRERRLAIMHDSRIGTFGVLALIASISLRVLAISSYGWAWDVATVLIATGAMSRAAMVPVMYFLGPARDNGLGAVAGRPERHRAIDAVGIGAVFAFIGLGPLMGIAALAAAALVVAWAAWLAQRRLGGYTGDVLGAVQQVVEIAMLLAALAVP